MMPLPRRLRLFLVAIVFLSITPHVTAQGASGASYADKLGIELEGLGDGGRSMPFVDLVLTARPWTIAGKDAAAPVDNNGWPKSDCATCLFDIRPCAAWAGADQIDDPDKFMPDWSGEYHLSLAGQAEISTNDAAEIRIEGQTYDAAKNVTTARIIVARGAGLCALTFRQTRRAADDAPGNGFTQLHVLRPGYALEEGKLFTNEFLRALKPFRVLRFMDWLDTNRNPGYYGDAGHHELEWKDRHTPGDATQMAANGKYGVSWEIISALANATGKDIWINIPVAASDDYVRQLAKFMKANLKPEIKIYIEHSNEVWNFGFPQYIYNKLAALDEVKRAAPDHPSPLNNGGEKNEEVLAHRRHAARLHDIAQIFIEAFGADSFPARIRPVYASWVINPDSHYRDVLAWCEKTYGPPRNYFYALAGAAYFGPGKVSDAATPDEILAGMRRSSDANLKMRTAIQTLATQYGLKHMQYEVGPDTGGGSRVNVANRIRANRLPGMKDLVLHDAIDNWFARGGDLYMYFASPGAYSRYGCWGLSEDIRDLATPKWQAIDALSAAPDAPVSATAAAAR